MELKDRLVIEYISDDEMIKQLELLGYRAVLAQIGNDFHVLTDAERRRKI